MGSGSIHDKLERVRKPRVHITYEVETEGAMVLKELPFVAHVRGEKEGMVWGVEAADHAGRSATEWANAFVLACYQGDGGEAPGVHLLGPLSRKVIRVAPPLVLSADEARDSMDIVHRAVKSLAAPAGRPEAVAAASGV